MIIRWHFLIEERKDKEVYQIRTFDIDGDNSEKIAAHVLNTKTLKITRGVKLDTPFAEFGDRKIKVSVNDEVIIIKGDIERKPLQGDRYDFELTSMTDKEYVKGQDYVFLGIFKNTSSPYNNCYIFQKNWGKTRDGEMVYLSK